jgi:hypothetical protein
MNSFWIIMKNPTNFAKGVAKEQLRAYKTVQIRHPEASKVDLIIEAISSRPNVHKYHSEWAIIKNARDEKSYQYSVSVLALMEYEHLTGDFLPLDKIEPMYKQVELIIPEDL